MIETKWSGLIPYTEALHVMETYKGEGLLWGLEHPPTVTIGRRGTFEKDLRPGWESHGLEVHAVDRGGQATLHSPGQLVIYPLLDLNSVGLRPRSFVDLMSQTTIKTLKTVGIEAWGDPEKPGIYTTKGKVGFLGFRISNGGRVTHGLSISVVNDLRLFDQIRPCGCNVGQLSSTSLEGASVTTEQLFLTWVSAFHEGLFLTQQRTNSNLAEV